MSSVKPLFTCGGGHSATETLSTGVWTVLLKNICLLSFGVQGGVWGSSGHPGDETRCQAAGRHLSKPRQVSRQKESSRWQDHTGFAG